MLVLGSLLRKFQVVQCCSPKGYSALAASASACPSSSAPLLRGRGDPGGGRALSSAGERGEGATPKVEVPFKFEAFRNIRFKLTKRTGHGENVHRSNKARRGLYHGTDVRFGSSVSHSKEKTNRKWTPNVISKRVWSEALGDWVRFKMTCKALKVIDNVGGVDNYLLSLDNAEASQSPYVTKVRELIASTLFHKGLLGDSYIKKLRYDRFPPEVLPAFPSTAQPSRAQPSWHLGKE